MLVHVRIGWPAGHQPFVYPCRPVPRTAVLVPWFRQPAFRDHRTRVFHPDAKARHTNDLVSEGGWQEQMARYAPQSIAGTWRQIQELNPDAISSLTHSLVVLHPVQGPRLTAKERDELWSAFGLPVFEQVIGPRGRLLATECEAHEGLHVLATGGDLMLENAVLNTEPCPCGRTTPRTEVTVSQPLSKAAAAGT